jgi:hypothetical protein
MAANDQTARAGVNTMFTISGKGLMMRSGRPLGGIARGRPFSRQVTVAGPCLAAVSALSIPRIYKQMINVVVNYRAARSFDYYFE